MKTSMIKPGQVEIMTVWGPVFVRFFNTDSGRAAMEEVALAVESYHAIKDALGTGEDGEALVRVAQAAANAERELAAIQTK